MAVSFKRRKRMRKSGDCSEMSLNDFERLRKDAALSPDAALDLLRRSGTEPYEAVVENYLRGLDRRKTPAETDENA